MPKMKRITRSSIRLQAQMTSPKKADQLSQLLRELYASDEDAGVADTSSIINPAAESPASHGFSNTFHHPNSRKSQEAGPDMSTDSDIFSSITPSLFYRLKSSRVQPVNAGRFRSRLRSFDPLSSAAQFAKVMLPFSEMPESASAVIDALPSVELSSNATWENGIGMSVDSLQNSSAESACTDDGVGNGFVEVTSMRSRHSSQDGSLHSNQNDGRHSNLNDSCHSNQSAGRHRNQSDNQSENQSIACNENFSTPPETMSEPVVGHLDETASRLAFTADSTFVNSIGPSPESKRRRVDATDSEGLSRLRAKLLEHPLLNASTSDRGNKLRASVRRTLIKHLLSDS